MTYWQPERAARKNDLLDALMNTAAAALHEEDERVARLVRHARDAGARHPRTYSCANVGCGLSYWVYETTLVYLVWRGWMHAGQPAALDWTIAQLDPQNSRKGELRGKSFDLAVFSPRRGRGCVFETKRWEYSPKAMRVAVRRDADKLRAMPNNLPFLANPQKYWSSPGFVDT